MVKTAFSPALIPFFVDLISGILFLVDAHGFWKSKDLGLHHKAKPNRVYTPFAVVRPYLISVEL
jgi:hypothetical protein